MGMDSGHIDPVQRAMSVRPDNLVVGLEDQVDHLGSLVAGMGFRRRTAGFVSVLPYFFQQ